MNVNKRKAEIYQIKLSWKSEIQKCLHVKMYKYLKYLYALNTYSEK